MGPSTVSNHVLSTQVSSQRLRVSSDTIWSGRAPWTPYFFLWLILAERHRLLIVEQNRTIYVPWKASRVLGSVIELLTIHKLAGSHQEQLELEHSMKHTS